MNNTIKHTIHDIQNFIKGYTFQFVTNVIIVFLMFLTGIELFLRIDLVNARLAAPSFGSSNHYFEIQIARLEKFVSKYGSLDCVFLGDSLVWLGINPSSFLDGYAKETGEEIRCFNFGVPALPASGASILAKYLNDTYNPKLIIYGLHANSLVVSVRDEETQSVLNTPWLQHQIGNRNFMGWLYEKSYFVRYLSILNRALQFDTEIFRRELGVYLHQQWGHDTKAGQRIDFSIPPDRNNPADKFGFENYFDFTIYSENIQGIQAIADLDDSDTNLVMVIMPVHPTFYSFFRNGEDDYHKIIGEIQNAIVGKAVNLIPANGLIEMPDEYWWDYSHLNIDGAKYFSYRLGVQVGQSP